MPSPKELQQIETAVYAASTGITQVLNGVLDSNQIHQLLKAAAMKLDSSMEKDYLAVNEMKKPHNKINETPSSPKPKF